MGILSKEKLEEIDTNCGADPQTITHRYCRSLLVHIKLMEKEMAKIVDKDCMMASRPGEWWHWSLRLDKMKNGIHGLLTGYYRTIEPEDLSANFCDGCSTRKKSVPVKDNIHGGARYCKECSDDYVAGGGTLLDEFGCESG